jgi:hypothetical protein
VIHTSSSKKAPLSSAGTLYVLGDRYQYYIDQMKGRTRKRAIGEALCSEGVCPMFPVIIIPGFASSSLEVRERESERERKRMRE